MGGTPARGPQVPQVLVTVMCPHCGAVVQVPLVVANQPCPACGGLIRVKE